MKISAVVGDRVHEVEVDRDDGQFVVTLDGVEHRIDARKLEGDFYSILTKDRSYEVSIERTKDGYRVRRGGDSVRVMMSDPSRRARAAGFVASGPEEIVSQMPGRVVRLLVAEGDEVAEGQGVIVVEAMKMENEISSQKGGTVKTIAVTEGQSIEGGARLLVIE